MYVLGEVDPTFIEEAWSLYGIGLCVLFLRFAIRLRTVGIRGFRGDDAFAFLLIIFFTLDAVTVHEIYYYSTNVEGAQIQKTRPLTKGEIRQLVTGSKLELTAWYSYATLVWCLKGTMVLFFKRMTLGLGYQRLVNYIGISCILGYIVVFCTITFSCWPIHRNYQVVPDPGRKCTLKPQNFITMTVLNVLTDALILYVPVPLLWAMRVPLRQKLVIGLLLCSGVFVISAAIIRVVSTLVANPSALTINRWGVRETLVGIIAVNAPILPPLFRKSFWKEGTMSGGQSSGQIELGKRQHPPDIPGACDIPPTIGGTDYYATATTAVATQTWLSSQGSQENIIKRDEAKDEDGKPKHVDLAGEGQDGQVLVETTFEVKTETLREAQIQDEPRRSAKVSSEERAAQDNLGGSSESQV